MERKVRLLLVEPNPERGRLLEATLAAGAQRIDVATTGAEALEHLAHPVPPDVVLLEERLPDMSAHEVIAAAARIATRSGYLVIAADEHGEAWVESLRAGLLDVVTPDGDGAWLTTLAARVTRAHERARALERSRHLADALASTAAAVLLVDRWGAVEYANAAAARLVGRTLAELSGMSLGGPDGILPPHPETPTPRQELLDALAEGAEWAGEVHVAHRDRHALPCMATLSPVLRSGGTRDGLVLTLWDVSDRVAMEEALRDANRRLADQARREPLTGLYNRGYFVEVLGREISRALRYGDELAVLMVDLDEFRQVNRAGHKTGDAVLRAVAHVLRDVVREGDVVARYGGDEFCALFPNTDAEAGRVVAERLCARVAEHAFGEDGELTLTVSAGLATTALLSEGVEQPVRLLLHAADLASLEAKRRGGNGVVVAEALPD